MKSEEYLEASQILDESRSKNRALWQKYRKANLIIEMAKQTTLLQLRTHDSSLDAWWFAEEFANRAEQYWLAVEESESND